jgi:hypothetical protein
LRPEHSPKKFSILYNRWSSDDAGSEKIAASSAYSEHLSCADFGRTGLSTPFCAANSIIHCNGSMARINSNGESGSPCHKSLACLIPLVGWPFTNTFEDDVPSSADTQSLHLVLNPRACITSRRNVHPMESNAFDISSLIKKKAGFFFSVKQLNDSLCV